MESKKLNGMDHKDKEKLFSTFPPVSTEAWEAKINADLKGADYNKKLTWKTGEGFNARPYYRKEDLDAIQYLDNFPGSFPFVRGQKINDNDWYVRQDIVVGDMSEANQKALDILMKGVDSLGFILDENREYSREDLDLLLKNIFAEMVEINFVCGKNALTVMENHLEMLVHYNRDFEKIYGSVDFDPLGRLILKGNYYRSEDEDFDMARKIIGIAAHLPHFTVVSVHGQHFHNAGASIVEELAFSLSAGSEYLTQLTERGLSVNEVAPKIKFNFAIGSDYFMEIAKVRAARMLWAQIVKAYGAGSEEICAMNIHAITSKWNMTVYDPYVNMLRTTTGSMASAIAGVDSLTVRPFDIGSEEPTLFSERIARSQQLLLKEESYFNKVADPGAGSYYIENLTDSIAAEAWKIFLEVDSKGGCLAALKEGFIQQVIRDTADKKNTDIATRKEVLLGTNEYPNFTEHIEKQPDPGVLLPEDQTGPDAIIETIKPFRGAMAFEQLRVQTDHYSMNHKRPVAFMFTYGNQAMRIARSQFSRNFFACAGYEVIDNPGFGTVEEGVKASLESKADIVVICSSDDEYPGIAPKVYEQLKDKAILVIAGYPKDSIEELKKLGISHFIHARSNVLETLQELLLRVES